MLAVIPHDLAPQFISFDADWFSFFANTASMLGFAFSAIGLIITISVKRQVRKIEREYVMRIRSRDWSQMLEERAERLLSIYESQPVQINEARVELAKASSLIKALIEQVPPFFRKEAARVLKEIEPHRQRGWFRTAKPLTDERVFELYLIIIEFGENLRHSVVKLETTPTR